MIRPMQTLRHPAEQDPVSDVRRAALKVMGGFRRSLGPAPRLRSSQDDGRLRRTGRTVQDDVVEVNS